MNGRIMVRPHEPQAICGEKPPFNLPESFYHSGQLTCIKVSDGWLIGKDDTHYGGDLSWFSNDGRHSYSIAKCNVRGFTRLRGRIFMAQGEAMLDRDFGGIDELVKDEHSSKWIVKKFAELPSCPWLIAVDQAGAMIIAGSFSLSKVLLTGETVTLIEPEQLMQQFPGRYFAPSSIELLDDDTAYIGMDQAVVEIRHLRSKPTIHCHVLLQTG
ncbi:MAG: hypothetical protein EHM48_04005, partial [Planctomycetaceae bacterium]